MAERRKVTKPQVRREVTGDYLWIMFYSVLYYPQSTPEYTTLPEPMSDRFDYGPYIKEGWYLARAKGREVD